MAVYFISDTHFDHANIIRHCSRPFRDVESMNRSLIANWNQTVKPNDTVFVLGDVAYGRNHRSIQYWLRQLNGQKVLIRGGHDTAGKKTLTINIGGHKVLLIHDPADRPKDWMGWTIHGHTHNNKPEFPLVNTERKTINVSCENTNYKPLNLERIKDVIK